MTAAEGEASTFVVAMALVAASYDTMLYGGDYEGAVPSLAWSRGRFGAAASLPMYRLVGNGRTTFGIGDAVVHGQATLVGDHHRALGVALAVGAPTGSQTEGLGMGHAMLMPAAFGSIHVGELRLVGSAGYGHAIGGASHHDHGAWPLVDPMSRSELTFSVSGDYAIAKPWHVGARFLGAVALDDSPFRAIAAAQAGWSSGPFQTSVELQAGLAGDPFRLRGLLQTAYRF